MTVVAQDESIRIEKLECAPFGTNAYILSCPATSESVLIDAPGEAEKIFAALKGTTPKYILMTHDHMDHVGALVKIKRELEVPLAAHFADSGQLPVAPELSLIDGQKIAFGNIRLKVIHTPGHTPGSVCFLTGPYLISGDTVFPGGPGKSFSPESFKQIVSSITGKIFPLPDETLIFPGHGDSTTLAAEKANYKIFSKKDHPPDLCGDVLWLSS